MNFIAPAMHLYRMLGLADSGQRYQEFYLAYSGKNARPEVVELAEQRWDKFARKYLKRVTETFEDWNPN